MSPSMRLPTPFLLRDVNVRQQVEQKLGYGRIRQAAFTAQGCKFSASSGTNHAVHSFNYSLFGCLSDWLTRLPHCSVMHHTDSGMMQVKAYEALLLDAGGTLLQTVEPIEETYATIGLKYGVKASSGEIKQGFKRAFAEPWPERLRYQGDGRPFWRHIVAQATGCTRNDYFEELYEHFSRGDVWKLPTGAYDALYNLRDSGVKLAVVSNFDPRLRKILEELNVVNLFNAIIISSEIGYEKPAPQIFKMALEQLAVDANKAVHIGDDPRADKAGANAVGIDSWLWGKEVQSFQEIFDRIVGSNVG